MKVNKMTFLKSKAGFLHLLEVQLNVTSTAACTVSSL